MSLILAIETSQRHGGVALRDRRRGGQVQVEMLSIKKRHDDDLLPAIDRLFLKCGLTPGDLKNGAVGVSIGPGGFTGLRIAIATAKMFVETLGTKVIAVPSALVVAESDSRPGEIVVALASKGDSIWSTRLSRNDDQWTIQGAPGLATAQTISLEGIAAMLGDEHLPADVRAKCASMYIPVIEPRFEPASCLSVAEHMFARGQFTDPLRLAPLYPREPEAVTLWEKKIAAKPGSRKHE